MTPAKADEKRRRGFQFAIDRGGTFTDVWALCPDGRQRVLKLLSEDPRNYDDAPREGIRRILEQETGSRIAKQQPVDGALIDSIRMGTTVATNALLERKGERIALVTTAGFRHLLHIGNQSRPHIFDLEIACPQLLYEEVVEVTARIVLRQPGCQLDRRCRVAVASTGEQVELWQEVERDVLRSDLQRVLDKGIRSLAVVFLHSYMYPDHEEEVGRLAEEMGFSHVSLSSKTMPMVKVVARGYTACADAYLTPCIKKYVASFSSGFKNLEKVRLLFMQSDGGLTPVDKFNGARAILSGPAGGVVGYAMTTYSSETKQPVIGFDMGGTSTDVSRFAGEFEHVFETTTAGVTIQAPQLDITTVAAGGGSRLFFRDGMFVVGPESVGAHPGPVCYKKGGHLAVTDANLLLGRLLPTHFPHIFGENEDQPLDVIATKTAFKSLLAESGHQREPESVEEVAMGFIRVANEAMCRPIRSITQARGHDTSRHVLACFGGAGGQHACAIARALGMKTIFIHRYAGILSAYGIALADVVHEAQVPCAATYEPKNMAMLESLIDGLMAECSEKLEEQGFSKSSIRMTPFLHLRYEGTDCALMCSADELQGAAPGFKYGNFKQAFIDRHTREFGFTLASSAVIVDDVRVRAVGLTQRPRETRSEGSNGDPPRETTCDVYFENGYQKTDVYLLDKLQAGHRVFGPGIIIDQNCTILVEPTCEAVITANGDIEITVGSGLVDPVGTDLDPVHLSIFSHRFMSTAEQMGRVLQRTSISTNIKERLDFSCALFGEDGGLVANAPHIPVHLGAMQETVRYQIVAVGERLESGDVLLCNHPCAGGSHLPDLTVITPVMHKDSPRPVFFVASRGHHADIGGISPGSMPPHSKTIYDEGAVFESFFLVKNGQFQQEAVVEALKAPARHPGSSGARNIAHNLSDLRAQVAANQKGIHLVRELIDEYGLPVVQAYMKHIQHNAEVAVRTMLKRIGAEARTRTGSTVLIAEDFMDDGSKIALTITIDEVQGSAVFDFAGTGYEVYGNCNAPKAVTMSAIIYCLRSIVGHDIPLNQGCLVPVEVRIPAGCLLDPSHDAAVVGGNVLTSQRVVDVILRAFRICAASQGCMNNVTFGDETVGYYETVAGGAGAGPTWDGRSGVHTHMTNTRITDPEILERRFPVVLQSFGLRAHSGGIGVHRGGDGVTRRLLFRRPLTLSVLSERRVHAPYGLAGGRPGQIGSNLLISTDGRTRNLGGKMSLEVKPGEIFELNTPGGGGYGTPQG